MPDNSPAPDAIGEPLTDMDQFWLETARTSVKESVASLDTSSCGCSFKTS